MPRASIAAFAPPEGEASASLAHSITESVWWVSKPLTASQFSSSFNKQNRKSIDGSFTHKIR